MSKITFEQWKAECLAFDPDSYHNRKASHKALSKLYSGFQTVKGQGVFNEARHHDMVEVLDELSSRNYERWYAKPSTKAA